MPFCKVTGPPKEHVKLVQRSLVTASQLRVTNAQHKNVPQIMIFALLCFVFKCTLPSDLCLVFFSKVQSRAFRANIMFQVSTGGMISASVSAQDGIVALGKTYALCPISPRSPQDCPRNSAYICLVEHRSFSTLESRFSAASCLYSSFLQMINAVVLWPVHVQKVPQASEHLCPPKQQTTCDICCACQSICPFIPTDSGVMGWVQIKVDLSRVI